MMRKMRNRFLLSAVLLLVLITFLPSCSSANSNPSGSSSGSVLSGTITEAGSTTVQPLAEKLANAFMKNNQKVTITIQGGGTEVGIKSVADGTIDIGASSRELNATDPPLQKFILARDGIAIIVNPANKITSLSKSQVRDIFAGKILSWKDLGGDDKTISVVSREEGSGTRTAFQDLVMGKDTTGKPVNIANKAIFQSSNGAIKQVVLGDSLSIGYLSLGYLDSSVKTVSIDGVAPTEANSQSGIYPVVRPLYFLTKAPPAGLVKAFLDYCQSADAQKIVAAEGYVPVNPAK
jgi:phosphate transport system substrate-binding protein